MENLKQQDAIRCQEEELLSEQLNEMQRTMEEKDRLHQQVLN